MSQDDHFFPLPPAFLAAFLAGFLAAFLAGFLAAVFLTLFGASFLAAAFFGAAAFFAITLGLISFWKRKRVALFSHCQASAPKQQWLHWRSNILMIWLHLRQSYHRWGLVMVEDWYQKVKAWSGITWSVRSHCRVTGEGRKIILTHCDFFLLIISSTVRALIYQSEKISIIINC